MALEIQSETQGEFRVLQLSGRLDTETAADFELAAHDLTSAGEKRFVVDLASISYVSSAGLRVLLALAKQMSSAGGVLRLSGMSSSVRQVFDLSGFSKLFTILPDLASALKDDPAAAAAMAAAAPPAPEVSKAAANLLGAAPAGPASKPAGSPVGRQAADLLGAKQPRRSLWARILGWLKGQ